MRSRKKTVVAAIQRLAPVTYIVQLDGPLAVALSMRAIAEGRSTERVISDAVVAHTTPRKMAIAKRQAR